VFQLHIVTINKDNDRGLARTLESFRDIPSGRLKYYFIDGKSRDASVDLIKDFCLKNDDCFFSSDSDSGIYDAMNKGVAQVLRRLDESHPNYLMFINSGDCLLPEIIDLLGRADSRWALMVGRAKTAGGWIDKRYPLRYLRYGLMPVCHQALIYNVNLIKPDDLLFSTKTWSFNDYRQLVHLSRSYAPPLYLSEVVCEYDQVTSTGISRSAWKFRFEKIKIIWSLFGITGLVRLALSKLRLNEFDVAA
jgi:glycosyltransferase involved in cell wall biosynthesis